MPKMRGTEWEGMMRERANTEKKCATREQKSAEKRLIEKKRAAKQSSARRSLAKWSDARRFGVRGLGALLAAGGILCFGMTAAVFVYAMEQDEEIAVIEMERDGGEDLDETMPVLYTETEKNEINNSRLIFMAKIPDGFGLDVQLTVCQRETGNMYQVVAYFANDYYGYLYVPAGEYEVLSCSVCGDGTEKYPMDQPEGFLLLGNDSYKVESALKEYDRIEEQIRRAKEDRAETGNSGENGKEGKEGEDFRDAELVLPWRRVETEGICVSSVVFDGVSNGEYRIIIEIVKSGSVRDALYHYSLDSGASWSGELHMEKTAVELGNTGLTVLFEHDEEAEYHVGDRYLLSVEKEHAVTTTNSAPGTIYFHVNGALKEDLNVAIRMYGAGSAKGNAFYYSLDGGKNYSEITLVPDSLLFQIPGTDYQVTFVDMLGDYRENQTFFISEKLPVAEKDYTPILMGLAAVVMILGIFGYSYMKSMMDKDSDYRFQVYYPVEVFDVDAKEKKKKALRRAKGK